MNKSNFNRYTEDFDRDGKVYIKKLDSDKSIRITYEDEKTFTKFARSLRKYNMLAYKNFIFNIMSNLRAGTIVGEPIGDNKYKVKLLSNKLFEFVYGEVYFVYEIVDDHVAKLLYMEPQEFLLAGNSKLLTIYKGVPIITAKDRFRVDMYYITQDKERSREL